MDGNSILYGIISVRTTHNQVQKNQGDFSADFTGHSEEYLPDEAHDTFLTKPPNGGLGQKS